MAESRTTKIRHKNNRVFHAICGDSFEDYVLTFRLIVWIVAVGVCAYFMLYQMQQTLDKLNNPPINTQSQILMQEHMDYPAVTFCYKNADGQGYDMNMLCYLNVDGYWIRTQTGTYSDTRWNNFTFSQTVNVSSVWENATYKFEPPFGVVHPTSARNSYSDRRGTYSQSDTCKEVLHALNMTKYWPKRPKVGHIQVLSETLNRVPSIYNGVIASSRYFHEHGQCYTVEPPKDGDKPMAGMQNGYRLTFSVEEKDSFTPMLPGGYDIFIHDKEKWWGENPLMPYRGESMHVLTGQETHIQLGETVYHSLNHEDNYCDNRNRDESDDVSSSECMEKCRWRSITSDYKCITPFMDTGEDYPECDNLDDFMETMDRYRQWTDPVSREKCSVICTQNCTMKIYKAQISKLVPHHNSDDVNEFYIFYPSGVLEELSEDWGYDMTLFIADFGGSLGFLLGISILSVLEILEGLGLSSYRAYNKWKREQEEEQMEKRALVPDHISVDDNENEEDCITKL